ncbi:PQQ-like beta-propeller repeat protein [Myxococcota bacterium]|nr:PQQ-like beta-propeller repeat protein [Myxococcota bacterium]
MRQDELVGRLRRSERGSAGRLWLMGAWVLLAAACTSGVKAPRMVPHLWQHELKDYWFGIAPKLAGDLKHDPVILRWDKGTVWAVDPESGAVAWHTRGVEALVGKDAAGGTLLAVIEPAEIDDHPGFSEVRELDRRSGRTLRTVRLSEPVHADGDDAFVRTGDRLIVAGFSDLRAYSLADGALLWKVPLESGAVRRPRVAGEPHPGRPPRAVILQHEGAGLSLFSVADGHGTGKSSIYGYEVVITPGTGRIFVRRGEAESVELDHHGRVVHLFPGQVEAATDDHLLVREVFGEHANLAVYALLAGTPGMRLPGTLVVRIGGPKTSVGQTTLARGRVYYEDRTRRCVYEMNLATHRERPIYKTRAHLVIGGDAVGVAPGVLLERPQVRWPFLFIKDQNGIIAWRLE